MLYNIDIKVKRKISFTPYILPEKVINRFLLSANNKSKNILFSLKKYFSFIIHLSLKFQPG